jgi:DNA-binding cell septation regulator SpoVG
MNLYTDSGGCSHCGNNIKLKDMTRVNIHPGPQEGSTLAFGEVVICGIVIQGFRILEGNKGPWVSFPAVKTKRGYKPTVFAVGRDLSKELKDMILEEYSSKIGL